MYSATSIIAALKLNQKLASEGIETVACPSPALPECGANPSVCEKGKNQMCKQPVTIFHEYKKLTVLTFRFMAAPNNPSGFIRKDDSSLTRLISHKFIDKTVLKAL
jgi:hypothetical protein